MKAINTGDVRQYIEMGLVDMAYILRISEPGTTQLKYYEVLFSLNLNGVVQKRVFGDKFRKPREFSTFESAYNAVLSFKPDANMGCGFVIGSSYATS